MRTHTTTGDSFSVPPGLSFLPFPSVLVAVRFVPASVRVREQLSRALCSCSKGDKLPFPSSQLSEITDYAHAEYFPKGLGGVRIGRRGKHGMQKKDIRFQPAQGGESV